MRPISKRHLARLLAYQLRDAACHGQGVWWSEQEAKVDQADSVTGAVDAAAAAISLCARCPVVDICAQRAEIDSYDGIAAGTVYHNGRPARAIPVAS